MVTGFGLGLEVHGLGFVHAVLEHISVPDPLLLHFLFTSGDEDIYSLPCRASGLSSRDATRVTCEIFTNPLK